MRLTHRLQQKCGHQIFIFKCHAGSARKAGRVSQAGVYKQAEEERQHAMDMAQFVLHRGGEVLLTSIDAVKTSWTDAKEVFIETLAHERKVY